MVSLTTPQSITYSPAVRAQLNQARIAQGQKPVQFAAPFSDEYIRANIKEVAEQAAEEAGIGDVVKNMHAEQAAKENKGKLQEIITLVKGNKLAAAAVLGITVISGGIIAAKHSNNKAEEQKYMFVKA